MGFALFILVIRSIVAVIFTSIFISIVIVIVIFISSLNDLCFCLASALVSILCSTFFTLVSFMYSCMSSSTVIIVDLIRCSCFCTTSIALLTGSPLLQLIIEGSSFLLGLASLVVSCPLILSCSALNRMLILLMLIEQAHLFSSIVLNSQCCFHLEYF